MEKELKDCPFCGGEAQSLIRDWKCKLTQYLVGCKDCGLWLKSLTLKQAIDKWNTRKG